MKLSRVERWILSNQCRILGQLFPEAAKHWKGVEEILDAGYEPHYEAIAHHVCAETMSQEQCHEITEILEMFLALNLAMESITDRSRVYQHALTFNGFSSKDEPRALAYAEFLCRHDSDKFTALHIREFDSHSAMMDTYRAMLGEWKASKTRYDLTKDDVVRITKTARG
jgi:uncharacterized protein YfbU (UPF0304 family)